MHHRAAVLATFYVLGIGVFVLLRAIESWQLVRDSITAIVVASTIIALVSARPAHVRPHAGPESSANADADLTCQSRIDASLAGSAGAIDYQPVGSDTNHIKFDRSIIAGLDSDATMRTHACTMLHDRRNTRRFTCPRAHRPSLAAPGCPAQ